MFFHTNNTKHIIKAGSVFIIVFIPVVILCVYIFLNSFPPAQHFMFEGNISTIDGDSTFVTLDIAIKNNIFTPLQYTGTINYKGDIYTDHVSLFSSPKFFDRIRDKIHGTTYTSFYHIDALSMSPYVINIYMYPSVDNKLSYVCVIYTDFSSSKTYFGPASSAAEAKKIEQAISIYTIDKKQNN